MARQHLNEWPTRDAGPDLERMQAIRDALVGHEGEPERLDHRAASPRPTIPEHLGAETALWAADAARRVAAEFDRLAGAGLSRNGWARGADPDSGTMLGVLSDPPSSGFIAKTSSQDSCRD
jgi:hypothetical protein